MATTEIVVSPPIMNALKGGGKRLAYVNARTSRKAPSSAPIKPRSNQTTNSAPRGPSIGR